MLLKTCLLPYFSRENGEPAIRYHPEAVGVHTSMLLTELDALFSKRLNQVCPSLFCRLSPLTSTFRMLSHASFSVLT